MKRLVNNILCGVLTLGMLFSMTGCGSSTSDKEAENSRLNFTAGTYEGEAEGYHGPIKVKVTVDNTSIQSIEVTETSETIGSEAVKNLPEDIVKAQSLAVDTYSGATVSSEALIAAVEDALKDSGVDMDELKKASEEDEAADVEVEEKTVQVVVVGAGGAGMTAALKLKDNGLDVVVLEKMSNVGGATAMSSSSTLAQGTRTQTDKDSPELCKEELEEVGDYKNDDVPVTMLATYSGKAVDYLADDKGVDYLPDTGTASAEYSAGRARMHSSYSGAGLTSQLYEILQNEDINVMLNTRAYELITEDNKVTGVKAHGKDKDYVIHADAVILATGGYCFDEEYISKDLSDNYPCSGSKANTGDGLNMVKPLNAQLINMDYVAVAGHGIRKGDSAQHTKPQCLTAYATTGTILVNLEGKRFVNETGKDGEIVDAMKQNGRSFMLMDQEAFDAYSSSAVQRGYFTQDDLDKWLEENGSGTTVFAHGDTLADVAKQVGMNEENLEETFNTYKSYVDSGEDTEFGRTISKALSNEGPYYLVEQCLRYSTTLGGVKINENLQIMNEEGNAIDGLYAAGEFVGGVFGDKFPPSAGVGWAVTSGYLVGDSVSEALK